MILYPVVNVRHFDGIKKCGIYCTSFYTKKKIHQTFENLAEAKINKYQ